jgi:hypothetical protein
MVKVLDDAFGVESGLMTTIHGYTGDQSLVDGPHRDLRRARAAAVNLVPTSTGAARSTGVVLRRMQGRLDGISIRVPVPDGSLTDFVAVIRKRATVKQINEAFKAAASRGPLAKVLDYSEEPLVSSDIVGSPASCTFDAGLTMSQGTLVKICGWYDNEWGYSSRMVDLTMLVGRAKARPRKASSRKARPRKATAAAAKSSSVVTAAAKKATAKKATAKKATAKKATAKKTTAKKTTAKKATAKKTTAKKATARKATAKRR